MSGQSVITNRDRNCLACRLISGCGLIGAGFYVSYQSKKFNRKPGVIFMYSVATSKYLVTYINLYRYKSIQFFVCIIFYFCFFLALGLLGTARILDLPPFRH